MPEAEKKTIEISDGASIPDPKDKRLLTAWSISFFGCIAAVVLLCALHPEPFLDILLFLRDGIGITFQITVCGILVAIPIGFLTGLGRLTRIRPLNLLASTYVEVIRGIPLLVQLCFIYYGLGRFIQLPDLLAAVIAMGICYGAYMGEVFRAGISAVDKGQTEAARSLGFNRVQTMMLVILPQAWRTILPPVGNEFIALLKDTSLVSVLAMTNILRRGQEYTAENFNVFETYAMVALVYLFITLILSRLVSMMEARLGYYDRK